MATNIGFATISIIPSFANLQRNLNAGLDGQTSAAGRRAGDQFGDQFGDAAGQQAGSSFKDRFKQGLSGLGGLVAGGGIVAGLSSLVTSGSEAEQALGGVRAVFKEYSAQVEADSAKAAQALGLSSTAYQVLATSAGGLLKNKGLADYADQAKILIQTGADLAAQFGGSTTEAVDALNSALKGESDPIERYNISLNETAVNAQLAATGQSKLKGAALDQAKVLARLAIIQEQSADAAGANAREAGTQAGQASRATASFEDLRTELGEKLLPAATALASGLNDKVIPALSGLADFATSTFKAFQSLPEPVRTATVAFVALRVAALAGLGSLAVGAIGALSTAFLGLTSRVLASRTAFVAARGSSGLLAATLAGLRAGAAGTAVAMRSLALAAAPVALITAGITLYSKFSSAQQDTKQYVDSLTAALVEQNGAISGSVQELAAKELEEKGLLKVADELGISLGVVSKAALGNSDALAELTAVTGKYYDQEEAAAREGTGRKSKPFTEEAKAARTLVLGLDELRSSNDSAVAAADRQIRARDDLAEIAKKEAGATSDLTTNLRDYAGELDGARSAIRKLIAAEKDRKDALLTDRTDALALEQQIANARKEAREGDAGLNIRTNAGRENRGALYDLAEQFNNSSPKVRNAEGAYERIRTEFIRLTEEMGGGETQAKRLADELLRVPQLAPLRFQTPGLPEAIKKQRELNRELREFQDLVRQNSYARLNNEAPRDLVGLAPGRGGESTPSPSPRKDTRGDQTPAGRRTGDGNGNNYYYNGPVTYTDDEQGRRRARNMERRASGDGSRRR